MKGSFIPFFNALSLGKYKYASSFLSLCLSCAAHTYTPFNLEQKCTNSRLS